MRFIIGIIGIVLVYGILNGALWGFWHIVHSDEYATYNRLDPWFSEAKDRLHKLEDESKDVTSQESYDLIKSEYDDLVDQYNSNVKKYDNAVSVLNGEMYFIPLPGRSMR